MLVFFKIDSVQNLDNSLTIINLQTIILEHSYTARMKF